MPLNFPNVSLLSLNQESLFFDAGFNYSNRKSLTAQGTINDLTNSFGISGIWTGQEGILNTIKNNSNFNSLILNGYNFGTGRILNFNFDVDRDVQFKTYTVSLEIFETGNLFNLTGNYYSGIDTSNFQFLQNFNESYSFQKLENGGYSSNRSANIQFNSGLGNLNAINSAKLLAKTLFTGNNLGFAFYSSYTSRVGRRIYNETYNSIDNSCSFSENFTFNNDSGTYSVLRTNSFDINENGIINVAENATIKGIETPTFDKAAQALDIELSGSFNRCNELYSIYAPASAENLINSRIRDGRTYDIFNNNLGYDVAYSNDRSNSGLYFWNYTQQVTYSDGIALLNENGTVIGRGGNRITSFNNAKNGYGFIKSGVKSRADEFYLNNVGSPSTNFIDGQSVGYSPYQGQITYNFDFSNEVTYTGFSGIKRIEVSDSNNSPIYSYAKYDIFNFKQIVQDQQNATQGQKSIQVNLIGERGVELPVYLENAKQIINSNLPSGVDIYINGANYTFDELNNSANVSVNWNYNRTGIKTISPLANG